MLAQNETALLYEQREMTDIEQRGLEMKVHMASPLLVGEEGDESIVLSIFKIEDHASGASQMMTRRGG